MDDNSTFERLMNTPVRGIRAQYPNDKTAILVTLNGSPVDHASMIEMLERNGPVTVREYSESLDGTPVIYFP